MDKEAFLIDLTYNNLLKSQEWLYNLSFKDFYERKSHLYEAQRIYFSYYDFYTKLINDYVKTSKMPSNYVEKVHRRLNDVAQKRMEKEKRQAYVDEYITAALHLIGFIECFMTMQDIQLSNDNFKIIENVQ